MTWLERELYGASWRDKTCINPGASLLPVVRVYQESPLFEIFGSISLVFVASLAVRLALPGGPATHKTCSHPWAIVTNPY